MSSDDSTRSVPRNQTVAEPIHVHVSLFDGTKPRVVDSLECNWQTFVETVVPDLLAREAAEKTELPGFILAPVDGKRLNENVGEHTALWIDADHVGDPDEFLERCSRYCVVLWETSSSTPEARRFRVVAARATSLEPELVASARLRFARDLGLDPKASGVDDAKAPSQVSFVGRVAGTPERWFKVFDGKIWEPSEPLAYAVPSAERAGSGAAGFALAVPDGKWGSEVPDLDAIACAVPPAGARGDRHPLVRGLGGWLARCGYGDAQISDAVRTQIPASDPDERASQAVETAGRARAGHQAPGWEALQTWVAAGWGNAKTLPALERACKDPREPEGWSPTLWGGACWSEWWALNYGDLAGYWQKRNAQSHAKSASGAASLVRTERAAVAKAERCAQNVALLTERAGVDLARVLETDDEGRPLSTYSNTEACVSHLLGRALVRNAATGREILTESVTLQGASGEDEVYPSGLWNDILTSRLAGQINRMGVRATKMDYVDRAVASVAANRMYWPVRAYLETLPPWDGERRSLCTYLGVKRSPYAEWVTGAWLRSCVARGMLPGCQVDHILVLEGEQGSAKSSALRDLAAGKGFGEFTAQPRDEKKVGEQLQGKWIVEIGELDKWTRRYSESEIKSMLTRREDDYRASYGHHNEMRPRTTVFAGSTNRSEYLTDDTGNRRYWPIVTAEIDLAALRADRGQLWAQALAEYREHLSGTSGFEWWPASPEIKAMVRAEQAKRLVKDAWRKGVRTWVRDQRKPFDVSDVLRHAVGKELAHITESDRERMTRCLRGLGCEERDGRWRRPGVPRKLGLKTL